MTPISSMYLRRYTEATPTFQSLKKGGTRATLCRYETIPGQAKKAPQGTDGRLRHGDPQEALGLILPFRM